MEKKKNYGLPISYVVMLTLFFPITLLWIVFFAANAALQTPFSLSAEHFFALYLIFALIYTLAVLILGIQNIVRSFRAYHNGDIALCLSGMLIHKYGLVLFFFVNFIVSALLSAAPLLVSLVASRGTILFALPVFLPGFFLLFVIPVFFTWLALIPGAFWGIQVIRLSRREGKLSVGTAIFHGFLQFLFLADVLDAMYLSVRKWGCGKKCASVTALLCLITVTGIAALLFTLW